MAIQTTICIQGLFLDSSLLADMESGINRLHCATHQCMACTNRHRHSNYDVITSPALGGGMHCPSASSYYCYYYFNCKNYSVTLTRMLR